jgi:hypothetical protein
MALVKAKWDEHIASLDKIDPWDQFETTTKWKNFFIIVMNASLSQHMITIPTCKKQVGNTFWRVQEKFNYMSKIGHNEDYWAMSPQGKVTYQTCLKFPTKIIMRQFSLIEILLFVIFIFPIGWIFMISL